jgi:hypothetical protein
MNTYSQHTRSWLLRFGAVAGVCFGLAFGVPGLIEAFTGETAGTSFTVGLGVAAFGVPALFAFYLHQADVAGRFGAVAFVANVVGLGLFAGASFAFNNVLFFVDDSVYAARLDGPTRFALLPAGLFFVVGSILFGVSMLRSGVMPRAAAVGYTVALPMIGVLGTLEDSLLSSLAHVVAAWSLFALSARVWHATAAGSPQTTGAVAAEVAPR